VYTVFVSGATGFIASQTIRQLLEAGHRVRGSVRHLARADDHAFLRTLPGASDRLELVQADLTTAHAFDRHVRGCDFVLHMASPYALHVEDPQRDLIDPAVNGTSSILEACLDAPGLRRVVLTSSMAAITDEPPDRVLTEDDWNERSTLARNPYYLSKTLAERAAWDFVRERSPRWDLVAINPFLVLGPSLSKALNVSNKVLVDLLNGVYPALLRLTWGVVDVRDVAVAHVRAMDAPAARGRYICAAQAVSMRELVDVIRRHGFAWRKVPRLSLEHGAGDLLITIASYFQARGVGHYLRTHIGRVPRFDHSKIERDLGLRFRPVEQTIVDTLEDLVRWGHIDQPRVSVR
jgi:dihydroflavonol-4-reductase